MRRVVFLAAFVALLAAFCAPAHADVLPPGPTAGEKAGRIAIVIGVAVAGVIGVILLLRSRRRLRMAADLAGVGSAAPSKPDGQSSQAVAEGDEDA